MLGRPRCSEGSHPCSSSSSTSSRVMRCAPRITSPPPLSLSCASQSVVLTAFRFSAAAELLSSSLLCSAGGRVYSAPLPFFPPRVSSFVASSASLSPVPRYMCFFFSFSLSLPFFPSLLRSGDAAEAADAVPLWCARVVLLTTEVEWERAQKEVERLSSSFYPPPSFLPVHTEERRALLAPTLSQWHRSRPAIGWRTSAQSIYLDMQ